MNKFKEFVEELAAMEVTPNVCNQYSYDHDENAARRENLALYLERIYKLQPKIMLIGEAPGYRGCRLTGVPFTSEHILMNNIRGLDLFGKNNGFRLAAEKEKLIKETTATIVWETLVKYDLLVVSWNAFPFHPHKKDNELSNRTPLKKELLLGEKPLLKLLDIFSVKMVVAMGNKAAESLSRLGIKHEKVRHPAQGGKNDFIQGMIHIKNKIETEGCHGVQHM
ncbi:MAG TPA: uracil-DNA glycosylase [Clostridiales bacterium]|nr:uracil-DNA glycosylase [Clostridiales bacterium]